MNKFIMLRPMLFHDLSAITVNTHYIGLLTSFRSDGGRRFVVMPVFVTL